VPNRPALPLVQVLNGHLTTEVGRPVVMIEVLPIAPGDRLTVTFKGQSGEWRQGIWLGVVGELRIGESSGDQFEIWTDTAPVTFEVEVLDTADRLLRLYNIWDSGRGRHRESQSYTSGMLREEKAGTIVYSANDIGTAPKFDKLVFEISR
jgi:hypothetical protein